MEERPTQERPTIVIVGNGMVGARLCQRAVALKLHRTSDLVVFGDERLPAYDRVHLTDWFASRDPAALSLLDRSWYADHGITLYTGEPVVDLGLTGQTLRTPARHLGWDRLVLATGSRAFVPPAIKRAGALEKRGVFVYRTVQDLEGIASWADRGEVRRAVVVGGGLLGLEAAKAMLDCGLEVTVVELAPHLMPRQLDGDGGAVLRDHVTALGVEILTGRCASEVIGDDRVTGLAFRDGEPLDADCVVFSAGISPRDELARAAGLELGPRGGVVVDDAMGTSHPRVLAVGEVAVHRGRTYGLVGPGYAMADVAAATLAGEPAVFEGADVSTHLKLLGVDVASFGRPLAGAPEADVIAFRDVRRRVYKRVSVARDGGRLLGGMLVGDASDYGRLHALWSSATPVGDEPEALVIGARSSGAGKASLLDLPDSARICACEAVDKGAICDAIRSGELSEVADVRGATRAGAGCGGCVPMITDLLHAEMAAAGRSVSKHLCEHFPYSRTDLLEIVRVHRLRTFDALLAGHGRGAGCEVCKPTAASIFASVWSQIAVEQQTIQDTNDRFLANIQRGGTYSVIPRVPGGELRPEQLVVLGQVALKYDLYTKITGGQRVAMYGARVDQLPDIWEELIAAGFESGHAYGKALRTIKACVGSDWCRYGVGDSMGLAIALEHRYKGLRAPHKLKSAVSGCVRECAEAQSKDFGLIAGDDGWSLYVAGNGGARPRHGDLLASGLDTDQAVQLIDRFLMYYIRTADKLTRTSVWLEQLEGGIDRLRDIVVHDQLGIAARLQQDMKALVHGYRCEWKAVVDDPAWRDRFRHFANGPGGDDTLQFVQLRGQKRPAPWADPVEPPPAPRDELLWVRLTTVAAVPPGGGTAVSYGPTQIAVFRSGDRWYATQNMCPHRRDMVLARGIVGDAGGRPKVACPMHKKTFDLETGAGLADPSLSIATFPVQVTEGGDVLVQLPPPMALARGTQGDGCSHACAERPSA